MIYVKIELWPRGDNCRPRLLHEALIWNSGGTASRGLYEFRVSKQGGFRSQPCDLRRGFAKNVLRGGKVSDFPRKRLYAVDLLLRALAMCLGGRNGVEPPEDVPPDLEEATAEDDRPTLPTGQEPGDSV